MKILITGMAGFIGFHLARHLSQAGHEIFGIDNLNPYYAVALKRARLAQLPKTVQFAEIDITDFQALSAYIQNARPDCVVHLAAQAGVRHSLQKPFDYASTNLTGQLSVLEACCRVVHVPHLIYASSSSVYGANPNLPYAETSDADAPVSLYGATKRSGEMLASSYAHLFGTPITGFRFFTVYGSWGRPDMAYWIFAEKILAGEPIEIFNHGRMRRDMTHVSDIVLGLTASIEKPPAYPSGTRPHRVYNLGHGNPAHLLDLVSTLESLTGRKAKKSLKDAPPGDVMETWADMSRFHADYGFAPVTSLRDGMQEFYGWFEQWRAMA